jgi:hypothetical protein
VSNIRRSLVCAGLFILLTGPTRAASLAPDSGADSWCGTDRINLDTQVAIHRDNQRRQRHDGEQGKALGPAAEAFRVGDVAVLVDDGSVVVQPNAVDLDDFGVQYVPQKKGGYVVSPSPDAVSSEIGDQLALTDDDAVLVPFPKGFKFRFFNKNQKNMFVHSDGNLSFGAADAASTDRSLDRLLTGPARIAPLFSDLNPEAAAAGAGVFVLASKTKVVVTWLEVPEFGQVNNRNTFQVVLYPNGRITFAFAGLDASAAVVGIAPGGNGQVQLVDYTASLPTGVVKVAVAERFLNAEFFDNLAIAKLFFSEFADIYDHLVVFLDFPHSLGDNTFAFELTIKNDIRGIGSEVFDATGQVGSKGRLRSFVQMGDLARYPDDPHVVFLNRTESSLSLLGHETGHRWLALPDIIDESGQRSDILRGRQRAHWSFCYNSLASFDEGNHWREEGGDLFTSVDASVRYGPLDQYIIGLIPASDVPPSFYIDPCPNRNEGPERGAAITGRRVPVEIGQIIAANGPRVPAHNKAPHSFNMAFVIVGAGGQAPSDASIAKVDRMRAEYEPFFAEATDGKGSVSTALKLKGAR